MLIDFDKFNRYELPVLTLCNPNRYELGQLSNYIDLQVTLNFNAVSELSFTYPEKCANGEYCNLYDQLESRQVIRTEHLGYYIITKCDETNDGITKKLSVTATSAEIELNFKKLNLFSGTYKFYDAFNISETLMGKLLISIPHWKSGYVSSELYNKYRTFDVSDNTLYGFMMNDVENSYECIFEFDTYSRTVNAYSLSDIIKKTDIYISYNNLIKEINIDENTDKIVTSMSCFGGGGLNISTVNPLGGVTIYQFDYFKSKMSKSLVDSVIRWEQLCSDNKVTYQNKLLDLKNKNSSVINLQGDVSTLEAQLKAQQEVQATKIQQGITKDSSYREVVSKISQFEREINQKKQEIKSLTIVIDKLKSDLKVINDLLSFSNRSIFNATDALELESYKYESTYQDESFIQTSKMTLVEIQDMAQMLYDQGEKILEKASQPKYNITVDSTNFLFLPEFSYIVNAINNSDNEKVKQVLGCSFNLEIANDRYIQPILLSVSLNFSDPTDFSMIFSNKFRSDNSFWVFDDLYGEGAKTSSSISFDIAGLKDWENYQNDLVMFANSSLDLSRNELVNNSKNIEMQFGSTGLIAKKMNPDTGDFFGEQAWLTYNTLAFSKDKFATVETALGKIPFPTGGYGYGLNANVLIGVAIFGSSLTLRNEQNNLVLDSRGFVMTTNNNTGRIILSPSEGIKVQGNNGSGFLDKFYVDSKGNVTMEGTLKAYEGTIGGITIKSDGLYWNNGDYMRKDGYGKISLMSYTPFSATFDGNIYAKNLIDQVTTSNIKNTAITSEKIKNDAITPAKLDRVYATEGEFTSLESKVARIEDAYITRATVNNLLANYASISSLNAVKGNIRTLESEMSIFRWSYVGDISIGSTNITNLTVRGYDYARTRITADGIDYWVLAWRGN